MADATNEKTTTEMLYRNDQDDSLKVPAVEKRRYNKRIRYLADPRINRVRRKRGGNYYIYRRGDDIQIYLGTADFILRAVTIYRKGKGMGNV